MARENLAATLQATALVHEAWLRLNRSGDRRFKDKAHFFATAAETMRHILVDRARRRQAIRHGGGLETVEFDNVEIATPASDERLLQVHEALDGLAAEDPVKAQVVKLRFFVGMSEHETAQALRISERTVERHWAYAKAWLYSVIREG
jgi:RNA polymerase sigma factor (TIGR02999 family)